MENPRGTAAGAAVQHRGGGGRAAAGAAEVAHLDEAVGVQCSVDFLLDGGREAVVADHDHGVEVVGFGAKNLALGRS